jgi:hypothetical protein
MMYGSSVKAVDGLVVGVSCTLCLLFLLFWSVLLQDFTVFSYFVIHKNAVDFDFPAKL